MMSGLGGAMMTGMAFGAGTGIAHAAVDSMMGGNEGGGDHGGEYQDSGINSYDNVHAPAFFSRQMCRFFKLIQTMPFNAQHCYLIMPVLLGPRTTYWYLSF